VVVVLDIVLCVKLLDSLLLASMMFCFCACNVVAVFVVVVVVVV